MLFALLLAAQSPADLSAFAPFAGSCWIADFTSTMSDTHCFEAMYGGVHVRDRHEVKEKGKIIYAGETVYSLDGHSAVFTYFNSLGGIGRGSRCDRLRGRNRSAARCRHGRSDRSRPDRRLATFRGERD